MNNSDSIFSIWAKNQEGNFEDYIDNHIDKFLKFMDNEGFDIPKSSSSRSIVKSQNVIDVSKGKKLYIITLTNKGDKSLDDKEFINVINKLLKSKMFSIENFLIAIEHHKSGELHCHMIVSTDKYIDKSKITKINSGNHVKVENIKGNAHVSKCVNYILKSDTKDGIDERVSKYGYRNISANFELIFKNKKKYTIYNINNCSYYTVENGKILQEEENGKEEDL